MRQLKPCGTTSAYSRHIRAGEEPCDDCRKANTEAKAQQPYGRVRDRAHRKLAHKYPTEWEALKADYPEEPRAGDKARAELARRRPAELRVLITEEFTRLALEETL